MNELELVEGVYRDQVRVIITNAFNHLMIPDEKYRDADILERFHSGLKAAAQAKQELLKQLERKNLREKGYKV